MVCLGHGVGPDETSNESSQRHVDIAGDFAADTAEESFDSTARPDTTQTQGTRQAGA